VPGKKKTDYELGFPFDEDFDLDSISGNILVTPKVILPELNTNAVAQEDKPKYNTPKTGTSAAKKIQSKDETPEQTSKINTGGSLTISLAGLSSFVKKETVAVSQVPADKENKQSQSFTVDQLNNCISKFAESAFVAGKRNLIFTLQNHKPNLKDGFEIEFIVDSKAQENDLTDAKVDLLNYLKSNLKNDIITISIIVSENILEKTAYTSQEKYKAMAEKNPNLVTLKNEFDLDLNS
jgi:DNA polymerase III subunit gamma/tau